LSSTLAHAPAEIGNRFDGQNEESEMKPLSRRPKRMVALAVALVFLLSGCPDGGSGDSGGGGYSISSGSAGG
jgi:hypothetical protein